jgi:hypothetical protein
VGKFSLVDRPSVLKIVWERKYYPGEGELSSAVKVCFIWGKVG